MLKIFIYLSLLLVYLQAQISIEQAWRKVEDLNDGLKATQSDIYRARLKRESAQNLSNPSLTLTANYTHFNDSIDLDINHLSQQLNTVLTPLTGQKIPSSIPLLNQDIGLVNLNILYPLYTGGKIRAAKSAYDAQINEAVAMEHLEKDKAFLKLVHYYYGVVMAQALYRTKLATQKALQVHYNHAKKLKSQGQIARAELLEAQVKRDAARIESKKAQHQLQIASTALSLLIKEKNKPKSPLFISKILQPKEQYIQKSTTKNAGIDLLNAKTKSADALIDAEKSAWKPKVIAYGNLNLYKGSSPVEGLTPSWLVGVMLKYDIFSHQDRNKEIEAAKLLRNKVLSLKTQAQEDLRLGIEKTYGEMMLYQEEFSALSSSLALAHENYKLRTLSFKEGLSTSSEVIDAQTYLSGVKTQRYNAAYNYIKQLALLCILSGNAELFFRFEHKSIKVK